MAEYWAFLNRLRQILGKSYTVAEEHTTNPRHVQVLVRRQRHDETLTVVMDTRWLALLTHRDTAATWAEYRELGEVIGHFFATPARLPSQTFTWPGSPAHRAELQRLLGVRRRSEAPAPTQD